MNRRQSVVAVLVASVLGVFGFAATRGTSATTCAAPTLSGSVASMTCGPTVASWAVGTSPPPTTTSTVPATTVASTVASTTLPPSTTTAPAATTTTTAPVQVTCTAFGAPTNTFTLNDALGSAGQINTATPLFTLQADGALSQYTVKIDDSVLPGTFRNYTSATVCIKAPPLTEGTHTISAVELAPTAQQVAPYTFLVDTTPPAPPSITSASYLAPYLRMSGTGTVTFAVKVLEGLSLRGGSSVGSTGLWSAAFSRPSGSHDLYAVQTDKAGNQSAPSNTVTVVVP